MFLAQRAALITGASRGIGSVIAERLAAAGCKVAVNYARDRAAADDVVARIRGTGGEAWAIQADVSRQDQAEALVKASIEAMGGLDIVVNNAGISRDSLLLRMTAESWQEVLDTNLSGAFFVTKAAAKHMIRQRHGRIINISSIAGVTGNPGQANYSAAKAGLIGFTKAVARELASRHVTVNAVAPGLIDVGMGVAITEEQRQQIVNQVPLGRLGTAQEVAAAVEFLAGDDAAYITGTVLSVDGGLTM